MSLIRNTITSVAAGASSIPLADAAIGKFTEGLDQGGVTHGIA